MKACGIITLTTDFSLEDGFVGIMKGAIYCINPQAQIVDITHHISPQNIDAASFTLLIISCFGVLLSFKPNAILS